LPLSKFFVQKFSPKICFHKHNIDFSLFKQGGQSYGNSGCNCQVSKIDDLFALGLRVVFVFVGHCVSTLLLLLDYYRLLKDLFYNLLIKSSILNTNASFDQTN